MARISIEPARAKETLTRQSELEKTLKNLYQEVESVRTGLNYKIAGKEAIAARLRTAAEQISKEAASTGALRSGLEEVIARYEQTESGNLDRVGAEKTSVRSSSDQMQAPNGLDGVYIAPGASDSLGSGGSIHSVLAEIVGTMTSAGFFHAEGDVDFESGAEVDLKRALEDTAGIKKIKDFEDGHSEETGKKYYYDPETKTITEVDEKDEKALAEFEEHNKQAIPVDAKLLGVGASGSISGWQLSGETAPGGIGGAKGSIDLLKLEGNASAYVTTLGVGASVGASLTAFTMEERAYLGTENTQIYEEVSLSAGKLGASASAAAGIFDQEGDFNPSLYVGASAEAIAGEISGSVGVKAMGADVSVKGSLNYGVGAHANVGIHDGKISVDIGATVGVGASVKLDIDVSGAVEAVGDVVGNVASGVMDFVDWITPW